MIQSPPAPPSRMPYSPPSLDELLSLCSDFELATVVRNIDGSYRLRCKEESFDLNAEQAGILAKGLLLGYFAFHNRDDLSLADWED